MATRGTNLNLLLVERDALDDLETRRLVGFRVRIVGGLEDRFVFGTRDKVQCKLVHDEQKPN